MRGMLRELGHGVLFLLCAAAGAVFISPPMFFDFASNREEALWQDASTMILGSLLGGGTWLGFRYTFLAPRQPKDRQTASNT